MCMDFLLGAADGRAINGRSMASGRDLALHLLNTVDIPQGTSLPQDTSDGGDHTRWAVVQS